MTEKGDNQNSEESKPDSSETTQKKSGYWSKHFAKHPKQYVWFKRFRKFTVFYLLFCIVVAMPTARAMFRPIAQLFGPAELQVEQIASVYTSKERPTFVISSRTCDRYNLRVFKREDFVETRHHVDSENVFCNDVAINPSVDTCYGSEKSFRAGAKPVYEEFSFLIANDLFNADKRIQLGTLPCGDYVAMFSGYNGFRRHADVELRTIRVTDLGLITKQDNNQLLIRSISLLDGTTKSGVPADLYFRGHDGSDYPEHKLTKVGSIKTDSDGNYLFKRPKDMADGDWEHMTVDANYQGNRAYNGELLTYVFRTSNSHEQYNVWKQGYRVFLKGDRPIYKLGTKIQFKGIVRYITDVGLKNVGSGKDITAQITDPSGNQSASIRLKTDEFGAFDGSYTVAAKGETGWYDISIVTADGESHSFRVCVEQYRKPEFVITVEPEKKITFSGEKLRMKVLGSYYFGGAVQGAEVKYTLRTSANWEAKMALFENPYDEATQYIGSYLNESGVVKTNELGEAVIEVDTNRLLARTPQSRLYDFGDAEITADVEFTDTTNHRTQMASGSAVCARANLALNAGVTDRIVEAGKPIELKIRAATFEGKLPEGKKVKAELYQQIRKNILSEELVDKVYSTTEVMINRDGTATASIPTTKDLASGWYRIACQSTDSLGRVAGTTLNVDIVSTVASTSADQIQPFSISFDKPQFKRNEEAKIIISTGLKKDEATDILVTVEGARLHEYRVVHANAPTAIVPIKIKDEYAPQAWVTATRVDSGHSVNMLTERLNVDPSFHYLNVVLTPLKKAYRAGDTAQCKVKVEYQDGKPAANSQLCFSMADESIYAVARESMHNQYYGTSNDSIEQAFYTDVNNQVRTCFSFDNPWEPSLETKKFLDEAGLYAIAVPLWPLMMVTGRMSQCESDFAQKKADLECKMSASAGAAPRESQQLRMEGVPSHASATKEKTIERPKTAGYENGGAAPRVRENFNDAAAWYPSITTDSKGEATISIKLPDDLTTWKGECNATDKETNVGSQTTTIITTQDFIARLGLPRFFTQGDKTIIEGTVHNYSDAPQSVRLTLTVTPQIKIGVPLTATINVPKGGQVTQRWPIEVVQEGEASVNFKAVGATAGDALTQKLPCRPLGYRAFFAKAGVIKDENGARPFPINIPADAKLATGSFEMTLSSSQIGPVLGSFDTLIDYPYGCTEQTLSKLIPSVVAMRLHTELGVDLSEASKTKFQRVYDLAMPKLADYQHADGGWGWWKDDDSRAFLTAQVLEGFFWLEKAEYSVERSRIDNGLSYLETAANSLFRGTWDSENSVDHAKAIYVLSLYGKNLALPQKAWQMAKLNALPPEALAYLTLAFKNTGDSKTAKIFYDRLIELKNESDDYNNWDHTKEMIKKFDRNASMWEYTYRYTGVETTALALRAVLAMEPQKEELIDSIVRWIILQRDENGWNNTKSTSQVFVALLERELATRPDRTTHFKAKVTSGQKLLSMLQFDKPVESGERIVKIGINPKPDHIKLEKNGPGWLYYTSLLQYDRPLKPGETLIAKCRPTDLKITRQYFRLTPYGSKAKPMTREQARTNPVAFYVREPIGDAPIHAGDVIQMRVAIESPISIPYVMVESALPSGGEVIDQYMHVIDKEELKPDHKWTDDNNHWWWDHQDVLDDRMGFFVGRMQQGKSVVDALIRMERPGEFGVNPVTLETMYSKQVRGYSTVDRLKVVE